jgi:anti-anti-sigma factor
VAGTLDLAAIGALLEDMYGLIDAGHVRLILDLGGLRLCDAAAMSGLVQVGRRCHERGGWLRLANPVGMVAKVFQIVLFGRDVDVYPTIAAATVGADDERIMR